MKLRKISNITDYKTIYNDSYTNIYAAKMDDVSNVVDVNKGYLKENSYVLDFEGKENKYMYNPKLLSKDIYGTPDLWFVLLIVNNIDEDADFDTYNEIRVLDYTSISFINRVLNTWNK